MEEVEIKFEREDLTGVIPVGTYLAAAARRMGIDLATEPFDEGDFSVVKITSGGELLSEPTKFEIQHLSDERRGEGNRVAEHAKIERAGELTIMTTKKEEPEKPEYEAKKESYRKEFQELPLEKKIASLVELEAIALSDTFSFIINSPSMIVGKLMDVLAELGLKMEDEAKKQTRPAEHQADDQPSVKEETEIDDPMPSVTEEDETEKSVPSVTEDNKTTDETENPLPSV